MKAQGMSINQLLGAKEQMRGMLLLEPMPVHWKSASLAEPSRACVQQPPGATEATKDCTHLPLKPGLNLKPLDCCANDYATGTHTGHPSIIQNSHLRWSWGRSPACWGSSGCSAFGTWGWTPVVAERSPCCAGPTPGHGGLLCPPPGDHHTLTSCTPETQVLR